MDEHGKSVVDQVNELLRQASAALQEHVERQERAHPLKEVRAPHYRENADAIETEIVWTQGSTEGSEYVIQEGIKVSLSRLRDIRVDLGREPEDERLLAEDIVRLIALHKHCREDFLAFYQSKVREAVDKAMEELDG